MTSLPNALEATDTAAFDFLWTLRRSEFESPEQHLMAAVMLDAVSALCHGAAILGSLSAAETKRRKDKISREAREWIESDERDYPFAFISVCDALKIEADWLRVRILRLERK